MAKKNLLDMSLKCALYSLNVGEWGTCEVQSNTSEDFSFMPTAKKLKNDYEQIFNEQFMINIYKNLPSFENFRPLDKSLVIVKTSNGLLRRGQVVSKLDKKMYRIALFDVCTVETAEIGVMKALPVELLTIPQFGVRASIKGNMSSNLVVTPEMKFAFLVTGRKENSILAKFTSINIPDEITFEASLLPWSPIYTDTGLKCVELKNNCQVQIVSYCSQHDIFLCPMDEENQFLRQEVCNRVVEYCQDAPDMDQLPNPCDIVASRFTEDNLYYRALVLTREENRVQVSYLDYGNIEYVTLDRLKPLANNLKVVPKTAVHVKLNDVMQGPLTSRAISFLRMVIMTDAKMIVKFTDFHISGVNLTSVESNENVNRLINDSLTPYWKLALAAGTSLFCEHQVFYATDIGFLPLEESQTFKFFVSHKETPSQIFGCNITDPVSLYVLNKLPKETLAYVEAQSSDCYTPRPEEICLAMWEGDWLRAVCLRVNQNGCAVYFIDWGNTEILSLDYIRRMPKDFVEFPYVVNVCIIHGLPDKVSDSLLNRLDALIPLHSTHMVSIMSRSEDEFCLYMPDIIATLTQEGFVTPPI